MEFSNWSAGEPNNNPPPENYAEIVNSYAKWNDANGDMLQDSYIEYEGLIESLEGLTFLGQYNGHTYFKNENDLSWQDAKSEAESMLFILLATETHENRFESITGDRLSTELCNIKFVSYDLAPLISFVSFIGDAIMKVVS